LGAVRTHSHRCDSCNDAEVSPVRKQSANSQCSGGGGELKGLSTSHHCHVNDVVDDNAILLIQARRVPRNAGRARRRCNCIEIPWTSTRNWIQKRKIKEGY